MALEDDLLALEARVLVEVGGDFFAAIAALRRMLVTGTGDIPAALARLAIPALEAAAQASVNQAWALGGAEALSQTEQAPHVLTTATADARRRVEAGVPSELGAPLAGIDALLRQARTRALRLVRSGIEPEVAVGPVFEAANTTHARVVTQVNAASNAAAIEVGEATDSPMVWEAERDACVFCLALAGEVIENPGDPLPKADRYAPAPKSAWTVERPPLHPHCRCRVAVLVDRSYADTLRREADRSILRGFSLESESQTVRLRAAQRLLDRDVVAPKSVKAYAAAAIKAGRFPTRDVPGGTPRLVVTRDAR